jgi:hypothetical protein
LTFCGEERFGLIHSFDAVGKFLTEAVTAFRQGKGGFRAVQHAVTEPVTLLSPKSVDFSVFCTFLIIYPESNLIVGSQKYA